MGNRTENNAEIGSSESAILPSNIDDAIPLSDYLCRSCLPTVAYLEGSGISASHQTASCKRQPVLLWAVVRNTVVTACTVTMDQAANWLVESKPLLCIPDNYNGLFELVEANHEPSDGYTTIAEIARIMPTRFFAKTPVTCVEVIQVHSGGKVYPAWTIRPGSTLRSIRVFKTKWKRTVETGFIKRTTNEIVTDEMAYLECETLEGKHVLISLQHRGRFFAVYAATRNDDRLKCVYYIKDLIAYFQFPLVCRLVLGKEPLDTPGFGGVMRLIDAEQTTRLIGSTIRDNQNTLFEVNVDASISVRPVRRDTSNNLAIDSTPDSRPTNLSTLGGDQESPGDSINNTSRFVSVNGLFPRVHSSNMSDGRGDSGNHTGSNLTSRPSDDADICLRKRHGDAYDLCVKYAKPFSTLIKQRNSRESDDKNAKCATSESRRKSDFVNETYRSPKKSNTRYRHKTLSVPGGENDLTTYEFNNLTTLGRAVDSLFIEGEMETTC